MKNFFLLLTLLFVFTTTIAQEFKIAFGSCGHQTHKQPVLDLAASYRPNLFIFLGDNIYGDTDDMDVLKAKYDLWQNSSYYKNLKATAPIIATWDDHDYGRNDSGKEYEYKEQSKEIFLEVFNEPLSSDRRNHKGIYTSYNYTLADLTIQVILLDGRTFRDRLNRNIKETPKRFFYNLDYAPIDSPDSTLLGNEQWEWLENELEKPADIRLIGSGTQFSIDYNGYEAWANFPHEQQKMVDLIKKTKANGVVFLSGDVHYAEISRINPEGMYPIYDLTSSGITSKWKFAAPNKNRIEGPIMDNHFGLLTISKAENNVSLKAEIIDASNNQRIEYTIDLDDLQHDN